MNLVHTYRNDEKLWDSVVETRKIFFENLGKSTKMKNACDMNSGLINKQHQESCTLELLKTLGISVFHNNNRVFHVILLQEQGCCELILGLMMSLMASM